jgi:DnaK suppressor protein
MVKKKAKVTKKAKKTAKAKKAKSVKKVAKKVKAKKPTASRAKAKKSPKKKAAKTTAGSKKSAKINKASKKTTKKTVKKKVVASKQQKMKTDTKPKPVEVMKTVAAVAGGALDISPYQEKKGEEYMNNTQIEHFKNILNKWKRQLMEEVDSTVVHMKEEAEVYADPVDRAAQEEGFNLELRTRDRERKLLKKIEQSLDLIESGEYGFCEDCGAEIGIRRLEARPTAEKCIDCKTFEEIREKQVGS